MAGEIPPGTPVAVGHRLHPTLDPSCCGQLNRRVRGGLFQCRSCDCYLVIDAQRVVVEVRVCAAHR
jgi:hypothetical protein